MVGYNILRFCRRIKLKNNRHLIQIAITLALFLAISGTLFANGLVSASSSFTTANNIELIIDYGNSTQFTYSGLSGGTVFDVLDEIANVTFTEFAYGRFIVSVNDVENNAGGNGYYWQYWVNDELGPIAADGFTLNDGDHILWKYCAPVYPSENSVPAEINLFLGLAVIALVGSLAIGIALFVNRRMR